MQPAFLRESIMSRTDKMKFAELLVLKKDIETVVREIGKAGVFQFVTTAADNLNQPDNINKDENNKIEAVIAALECTKYAYRIIGWIPESEVSAFLQLLENAAQGRISLTVYEPFEVPSVINSASMNSVPGSELEVPVRLSHGKFLRSFERMIFSYGAPEYGAVDPTPFVAVFFTLLFGIMFGDFGQGLFFLLFGILMAAKLIKAGGWSKFAPIFMVIGISSSVMGFLTGEIFGIEAPWKPLIHLMPSSDPKSIYVMFGVFGAAVAFGFVINSIGLILNFINSFLQKKYAEALLGKNGFAGALFFWYTVALILRIVLFKHNPVVYDWCVLGVSLFFAAFAEPFERKLNGEKKLFENGFGTYLISGVVELIEVFSGYLSNTVSFVRVGAFALSHAVLNFTVLTLTELVGGPLSVAGIPILILGNALIIVLEGMIVAIQVIRLQYYEFFSKFFHETGREFKPFKI